MTQENKDNIYDIINKNKRKFTNNNILDKEKKFIILLNKLNIELDLTEINIKTVFNYLTKHWNLKCELNNCNNNKKIKTIWPRRRFDGCGDISKYCSVTCNYESIKIRQNGKNNTCHRMTDESFKSMCEKNSKKMKEHIKNGTFTPNITNSWSGSKIKLIIENKEITYRSSWEAFFHLCNTHLEYEKIRIPYNYNNNEHNYITDFVDETYKIIYEIKPETNKEKPRNIVKFKYAKEWCKINGYDFVIISNNWFEKNYFYNKYLLETQESKEIIEKRLKQFENEN